MLTMATLFDHGPHACILAAIPFVPFCGCIQPSTFSFISQLHAPLLSCFAFVAFRALGALALNTLSQYEQEISGRIECGHHSALSVPTCSGVEWPLAKSCLQRMVHGNGSAPGQRRRRTVPAFPKCCAWCYIAPSLSAYYHTFQATMVLLGPRREEKPVARKVGSERSVSGLRAGSGSARKFSDEMIICRK